MNEKGTVRQITVICCIDAQEGRGLKRCDLLRSIGSRVLVSEMLDQKRGITMEMIRNLHNGLGIPAEVLIQPYKTVKDSAR